jgi:hypothetical protein
LIRADGTITDYDRPRTYDLLTQPIADLDALHQLLQWLLRRPDCCVVFGAIADPGRTRGVRRLAYPDPDTGAEPTLRAVPRQWCALDMDGIERPGDVPASDIAACAAIAVQRLPAAFRNVRCIVQATAGHGIKPGCRLRLWYSLDRATTGDKLGVWLKDYPVDRCTFRPAQPIYTAAPVFVGRSDHLPIRIVLRDGSPCVAVPEPRILEAPPRVALPPAKGRGATSDEDVERFIDGALARVRAAADGQKHHRLRDTARLLGGIQAQAGFSDAEAVRWLVDALPNTVKDRGAAERTARWGLDTGRSAPIKLGRRERGKPSEAERSLARIAIRMLRAGAAAIDVLHRIRSFNATLPAPVTAEQVSTIALWAARTAGRANARN